MRSRYKSSLSKARLQLDPSKILREFMALKGEKKTQQLKNGGFQILVVFSVEGASFQNLSTHCSDGVLPQEGTSLQPGLTGYGVRASISDTQVVFSKLFRCLREVKGRSDAKQPHDQI